MRFLFSTLLFALLSFSAAQYDNPSQYDNSSIFVYNSDQHEEFVFALQLHSLSGDLHFHLAAPAKYSWVGVGIGMHMMGSLMLILYRDDHGSGVTVSPRIAYGHSEPEYEPNINIEFAQSHDGWSGPDAGTEVEHQGIIAVDGVCRGCQVWGESGTLSPSDRNQPFIFALGPEMPQLQSDSKSAGLTQHSLVGHFTMDIPWATVEDFPSVPKGPYEFSRRASPPMAVKHTDEPGPRVHGVIMCVVFILLLPFGSLILRTWNKVKAHAAVQILGSVLFVGAFSWGVVISKRYNRSKHFNSAHQVIGILLLLAISGQLVLGLLHHRVFKKEQRKTTMGQIHLYLGPVVILMGLVNGGLGFALARNYYLTIPYAIVIIVVGLIFVCIRVCIWRRRKQNQAYNKEQADIRRSQRLSRYNAPKFGAPRPPPDYKEARGQWRAPAGQDVPLERYRSSEAVHQTGLQAHEPKPMV